MLGLHDSSAATSSASSHHIYHTTNHHHLNHLNHHHHNSKPSYSHHYAFKTLWNTRPPLTSPNHNIIIAKPSTTSSTTITTNHHHNHHLAASTSAKFVCSNNDSNHHEPDALALITASALTRILSIHPTRFFLLRQFIKRLIQRTNSIATHVITAVILLARLRSKCGTRASVSENGTAGAELRLVSVALMLAHKMTEDACPVSREWAQVSCISSVEQLLVMELEFLYALDFHLVVSPKEFRSGISTLSNLVSSCLAEDNTSNDDDIGLLTIAEHKKCIALLSATLKNISS